MSKHLTNDFCYQFSACFNVCVVGGSRTKQQPHSEVHSCPRALIPLRSSLKRDLTTRSEVHRWAMQYGAGRSLCLAGWFTIQPLYSSFPFLYQRNLLGWQVGLALPYDWKSWAIELGHVPVIPGVGQVLLHSCSIRSPSDTEIGFAKCSQL